MMKRLIGLAMLVAVVGLLIAPAVAMDEEATQYDPCGWCGTVPGWCWLCLAEMAWEGGYGPYPDP